MTDPVPKTKFYEHGSVRTALREKFVDDIQRITWAYKLADDTIRLRGTATVPEIQVFTIETKGADVSEEVLAAIDKTVHFPIIFEVASTQRVRMVAAQKTLNGKVPHIATYFTTDLPSLYEALLGSLLPVPMRAGETVSEATDRLERARKLQREMVALEKKLRNEPQLNRKIDLRRQLKERETALVELTDTATSNRG